MRRFDLRGVAILVALANWSGEKWAVVVGKIAEGLRLGAVKDLEAERLIAAHTNVLGLRDSVAALMAGSPFIELLTKQRIGVRTLRRLASTCRKFLDLLIAGADGERSPEGTPDADEVLRRPIRYRFVSPLWLRTRREDLRDAGVSGWGAWHPLLEKPDDLLTWAFANALENDAGKNVGICAECKKFYFSDRRGRHRFCSSSCRDRHWNQKTGAERTRRSRGRSRSARKRRPATFKGVGGPDHVPSGGRN